MGTAKSLSNFALTIKTPLIRRSYKPAAGFVRPPAAASGWTKYAGIMVILAMAAAALGPWKIEFNKADAATVVYTNGYPTINGNYVDCNGDIDNDMGHHVTVPGDTDPAHHIGQNCPAGSLVVTATSGTSSGASSPIIRASVPVASTAASAVPVMAVSSRSKLDVWWPVDGATIMGTQPFKAAVENTGLDSYQMFWQVDGGASNLMSDSQVDGAHKESQVDVSAWNWKGSGPYTITFTAKSFTGTVLAAKGSTVYIPAAVPVTAVAASVPVPAASSPGVGNSSNPLAGAQFYRNLNSNSQQWINANSSQTANVSLMGKIASQPNAVWLGGWNSNVASDAAKVITTAKAQGQIPIFVIYNIPNRDCGGYSGGGAQTPDAYKQWIRQAASGIGSNKAAVVLEPDGAALTSCLSSSELQTRYSLLSDAVSVLKSLGNTAVYIDAGHPDWISASDMASRLKQANIATADGFALNISNFTTTPDNISYGQQVSALVGNRHFIIDTSRNGNGPAPDNAWCNPSGRALGAKPTSNTGYDLVDALIWGKDPGGSDGSCNGGPPAGVFWPDYALGLASRAAW